MLILLMGWSCLASGSQAGLIQDIEFAKPDGVSLTLDAFVPEGPGPFPTVILVHGGGFDKGDKTTYIKPLFEPLSQAGFAWFTINYRLAGQRPWPACLEDVETAIRWVKAHAAEYKVDVKRIALVGESAGGHLVSYAGARSQGDTSVAAVVPFYAPHDLEIRARARQEVKEGAAKMFGVKTKPVGADFVKLGKASPVNAVKAGMPPYLLIHGDQDPTVPHDQSIAFQKKMQALGNVCDLITVHGGGHGMGPWSKLKPDYAKEMVAWLRKVME
ncbi:alpha/beta hydrolase [Verrucomicrobium spinosum]|uniref:alpha/beta hydrolase n=1 Tax=Verrucomicrobium spinosum TaxID=2736 RepID=UPI0018DB22AA|nr:alpha/beta hydrolase [Verrucomicrobium spinosum]